MAKFLVLPIDTIAEWKDFFLSFQKKHGDLMEKSVTGFKDFNEISVFRIMLGHKGNAIYQFVTERKFSLNNIKTIKAWIDLVKNSLQSDNEQRDFLDQGLALLASLHKEIVEKDSSQKEQKTDPFHSTEKNEILDKFANTSWYVYERFEAGIGRKVMEFGSVRKNGLLDVTLLPVSTQFSELQGTCTCDSTSNYLLIETSNRKRKSANTNFMIRVEPDCAELSLVIGHCTFQHRDYNNVITKTVILEKQEKNAPLMPRVFGLDDESIVANKEPIIKFLYNRDQNRLSSPQDRVITDIHVLRQWHDKNDAFLKTREATHKMLGGYDLYYCTHPWNDTTVTKHSLEFEQIRFARETKATFIHSNEDGTFHKYIGNVHVNDVTKALSVLLHGPYRLFAKTGEEYIADDKQVFLMLSIPLEIETSDTFTGIISGTRDKDEGLVSRLVVVVRREKDQIFIKDQIPEDLKVFFKLYRERSRVRPPKTKISRFAQLNSAEIKSEAEASKKRALEEGKN